MSRKTDPELLAEVGTGVYAVICLLDGRTYVGSTSRGFGVRWDEHYRCLADGRHDNDYFQKAWRKHGRSNFIFVVLERCAPGDCLTAEKKWMTRLRSAERKYGYNSMLPVDEFRLGCRHSEAVRKKIGRNTKKAMSTPLVRGKLKLAAERFRDPKRRAEIAAKVSAGKKLHYANPGNRVKMLARKRDPKYRAKKSEGNVKAWESMSEEERAKRARGQRDRWSDPDFRSRCEAGMRKPKSPEGRAAIGKAQRARRERERLAKEAEV